MPNPASSVAVHAVLTAQRGATIPFRITHFALPLAAFVALMLLFASTSIDVNLAHAWAYNDALQVWVGRRHWWADVLLHRDGRDAILLVILGLLGTLATGFFLARARAARRTAAYVLVTIVLSCGLVGGLKHVTNIACPWDLQDFGGQRPHVALFDARPLGFEPAACFPGAHSGSGFSLFAFYFALRDRRPRAARMALWISLAVGALFAFGQEARGAHFLSHDVCSAFVAWFVALATYSAWVQRPTPDCFAPAGYDLTLRDSIAEAGGIGAR